MGSIPDDSDLIICSICNRAHDGSPEGIDPKTHPTAQKLFDQSLAFLEEVKDLTPGQTLEHRLNTTYGPGNPHYDAFCTLIKTGLAEGWIATHQIDGTRYRRGKISLPSPSNLYMSLTAVYFDTTDSTFLNPDTHATETGYAGQYHKHPYGEINCVVPIDEGFELEGMPVGKNWRGAGWTSLGPGTHHFPRARGGRGVAFFFLPSGRIAYDVMPGEAQPVTF